MTKITLPRVNQTGANEWSDVESNDQAIATVVNGELDNENIKAGANIARSKLEGGAQGIAGQWYTPTVIATEQTRESTSFGTLSTPDEITGIVLPTNGLIRIRYAAVWKSSVSGAGIAAVFLSSNQVVQGEGAGLEASTSGTEFKTLATSGTSSSGRLLTGSASSWTTTGASVVPLDVFASAGTYSVSVKYRASSGSVTAKDRKLWVEVIGY